MIFEQTKLNLMKLGIQMLYLKIILKIIKLFIKLIIIKLFNNLKFY